MHRLYLICVLAVLRGGAAECATILLPGFPSLALTDWSIPAARYPDRYTPAGYENVGGLFGMASLMSVDPLIADTRRARYRMDEFPYHERPGPNERARGADPAPVGLYAWLYLPDLQPGGLRRPGAPPPEYAMIAFSDSTDPFERDAAPAICDSWRLVVLTLPGGAKVPMAPLPGFAQGRTRFHVAGTSAAAGDARYAALLLATYAAELPGPPAPAAPARRLRTSTRARPPESAGPAPRN